MICPKCNHRPSMRVHLISLRFECDGEMAECQCPCHDAADAGPELLAVASEILDDARGDLDKPNKRLWPIRAENYRQLTAAIALAKEPK